MEIKSYFSLEELKKIFKDGKLNNSPASFSLEKLLWFNREYFLNLETEELLKKVISESTMFKSDDYSLAVVDLVKERCSLLSEFENEGSYFFEDNVKINSQDAERILNKEGLLILDYLNLVFREIKNWDVKNIKESINKTMEEKQVGMASVGKPLRLAITGRTNSASVDETCFVLGKERVLERLKKILDN